MYDGKISYDGVHWRLTINGRDAYIDEQGYFHRTDGPAVSDIWCWHGKEYSNREEWLAAKSADKNKGSQ
jgi:hypothetical protein